MYAVLRTGGKQYRVAPGDVVKIEETRPLSKLKRWQLKEIVRRAALVAPVEAPAVSEAV